MRDGKMRAKLEDFLQEVCEKTITNNQYPVLTSSKSGLFLQSDYFNKQVASKDNTGYKIIRRGQFTYRAMSDTGKFFPNMLECADVGIVSPAYPVFEIIKQDQIVPEYLNYYFKSNRFQNSISTFAQGSTRTSVKFGKLKKVSIELPEIKKQYQIIRTLDLLRTIINNRKKEVLELDELIRARFIELFGDPQRNPHGYKHTKLSDIATYYNGLTYKPENVATEGTIVLRSSNIQNSQLDFADTVRVDCAIKERLMVQKNDILMCSRNGSAKLVGKVALIKDIQEPMSFGAFIMIIRSHYFGYLMTYFQMDAFRQQIKTGATTTINQITGRMLDDVTIPLPPMSLVDQFATFVEQIDKSKLLSGCRLFHSWAPEIEKSESCWRAPTENKGFAGMSTPTMTLADLENPEHVGVPQRKTKVLRGGRRQQ